MNCHRFRLILILSQAAKLNSTSGKHLFPISMLKEEGHDLIKPLNEKLQDNIGKIDPTRMRMRPQYIQRAFETTPDHCCVGQGHAN